MPKGYGYDKPPEKAAAFKMKRSPAKGIGWVLKGGAWVYRGAKTLVKKALGKSSKVKKKSDSISAMTYDKSSKHLRIMGKTGDVGYIPVNLRGGKLSLSGDRRMSLVKGMDFSGGLSAIDKYNKMSLNAPKFKASTAYKRYGTIDYKGDYYLSK